LSTLIVQLPPRDLAIASEKWSLSELPFVLLDRQQKVVRTGRAQVAMLPHSNATVLMIAARDLLLLQLALPSVKGQRLIQALPNVIEDLLIQDAHACHIAVDRQIAADGRRIVAAIDRNWFRFVLDEFTEAGRTRIKAVPIVRCLPKARDVSATVAGDPNALEAVPDLQPAATLAPLVSVILGAVMPTAPATSVDTVPYTPTHVEVALARGELGEGMALRPDAIAVTLAALAGTASVELYQLGGAPGTTPDQFGMPSTTGWQAQTLPFETLARAALECEFDLCQFEYATQPLRLSRATFKRWRVPAWLAGATLLVAIVAGNLDWLMLSRQRAAMLNQQVELLMSAFPKTSVVLDPPVQMTRALDRLRTAAGEPAPDDFVSLINSLARSLAPLAPGSIAQITYKERTLQVTFTAATNVNGDFAARLRTNGLSSHQNGAVWIIGSRQ